MKHCYRLPLMPALPFVPCGRAGFTIVELVVSLSILGLLMALLIPAIQSSRESARRLKCTSQLREIGVALQNFEATNQHFPHVTFQFKLLPFIDQRNLFDLIPSQNFESQGQLPTWELLGDHTVNLYCCASDSGNNGAKGSNYLANFGSSFIDESGDGLFALSGPIKTSDVVRGLSNTAAVAEGLVSIQNPTRLRRVWGIIPPVADTSTLPDVCERIALDPGSRGYPPLLGRGIPWYGGVVQAAAYNHLLSPNRPSCMNEYAARIVVLTSSSLHSGGVNLLYADGHVRFENQMIDRGVWRELGSRSGTPK